MGKNGQSAQYTAARVILRTGGMFSICAGQTARSTEDGPEPLADLHMVDCGEYGDKVYIPAVEGGGEIICNGILTGDFYTQNN
jgi:hypothetical protein